MKNYGKMALTALAFSAFLAFGGAAPASANVVTFELNVDGCSSGCGLSDYGTVTVTDIVGGGVHVDVSLVNNVDFLINSLYFSLSGSPNLTLANITPGFAGGDTTGNAIPDNFTIGQFGWFDYTMLCNVCGPGASNTDHGPLDFDITNTSVTSADFLSGKGNPHGTGAATGIFFVVDIASFTQGGTLTGNVGAGPGVITECTGTECLCPPGVPDCTPVPEPITLSLFGAGLAGAASIVRRRKKKTV
jgi:hypothetical protein